MLIVRNLRPLGPASALRVRIKKRVSEGKYIEVVTIHTKRWNQKSETGKVLHEENVIYCPVWAGDSSGAGPRGASSS